VLAIQLEKEGASPTVDDTTSVSNPFELVIVGRSIDEKLAEPRRPVERDCPLHPLTTGNVAVAAAEAAIVCAISQKVIELRERCDA
jgi:hypothetical protein